MTKLPAKLLSDFYLTSLLCLVLVNTNTVSSLSDQDIQSFSETILKSDTSGLSDLVRCNLQGRAQYSKDSASQPLLNVDQRAFQNPTVAALKALFDNYDPDVTHNEIVTEAEKLEEFKFINAVMQTQVMKLTYDFLKQNGLFRGDLNSFGRWLAHIWFSMYSRGSRVRGSSAFEHVFLGEIKNRQVIGLHNWIYFNEQEKQGALNYLGRKSYLNFEKGSLVKVHFNWNKVDKPVSSLFVGTSPELELALYSVCYLARPGRECFISLNGHPLVIRSHTFRTGPNSPLFIGSIYPDDRIRSSL